MPIVAHNALPTFERLRREGRHVLDIRRAEAQDIRPLHVGLLNMMPDAALEATERQFLRLVGASNPIAQFRVHPFTLDSIPRGPEARAHIRRHYEPFAAIRERGLDALIVSGANPVCPELADEPFWGEFVELIRWSHERVTSTLCSCLATHAVLLARHGVRREPLAHKRWGVYAHAVTDTTHPLVSGVDTHFEVPHSRGNDIPRAAFERVGLHVLMEGEVAGVQLATSADGFRTVFLQGHPEYDAVSLVKEYKRELGRRARGETEAWPPFPHGVFDRHSMAVLDEYRSRVEAALEAKAKVPPFPEAYLVPRLRNTWLDSGKSLVGNWLGLVYQATSAERDVPFMAGVDPEDPLGWVAATRRGRRRPRPARGPSNAPMSAA